LHTLFTIFFNFLHNKLLAIHHHWFNYPFVKPHILRALASRGEQAKKNGVGIASYPVSGCIRAARGGRAA
jgi:hypothetical protein